MHTAVAIPCLNEAATLVKVCASLGYSDQTRTPPPDTTLILVDNGSTDGTVSAMAAIRSAHPGAVIMGVEFERGYIPPRHRGVLLAKEMADARGIPADALLILQADADTLYDQNYVQAMQKAAAMAPGNLIEGVAHEDFSFEAAHPGYEARCAATDAVVAGLLVPEAEEVILDDKVAGFRLSDYLRWGGLQREFDRDGDEIHAETSRLYIRAKTFGAGRVRVGDAIAFPSRRKLEADPLAYFATAGFPREAGWRQRWAASHKRVLSLDDFERSGDSERLIKHAAFVRQMHMLVLFALVPIHVQLALGTSARSALGSPLGQLLKAVAVDLETVKTQPGQILDAFLHLADDNPELFADCIAAIDAPVSQGS
ncbi:glycosyltransferase family 2 protein [Bradyrhizobium sp. Arg314]